MRSAPWWAALLVRSLAPRDHVDDVLGDLEEAHRRRAGRHGPIAAHALTTLDAVDMAAALTWSRFDRLRTYTGNSMIQDYKLGLRMLVKYPGLTIAGGLALAIAIGIGAGWYDLSRDLLHPKLPLPHAERIVEIEMRDAAASGDERRLLHDFIEWRREIRTVEALGAYRTVERNLALGDARPEAVTAAEITASAFRLAAVPPLLGRTLLDSDEQPGAPAVVVLGYTVWQQRFGGRSDITGHTVRLGRTTTTVVGVMPEGFAFPVNHRLWVPLQLRVSGYQPLEGPPIRVFGRIAPGSTQAQANAELTTVVDRARAAAPKTYEHLRPRVLAYGGESPGDRSWFELMVTHLPVVLVLIIACANVGTLIYARTATRDAEIAIRYSLGASRGRIVGQLFIEALVLSSVAAVAGLMFANWALKRGMDAYFSGQPGGPPFWINPGLKLTTMLYAAALTVIGGAILGVLPAIKATRSHPHGQLRNLGSGGSTLRFGWIWTTVMIGQVALTLILLPPAIGITQEAWRDRAIRGRFPAGEYLAVQIELDREGVIDESDSDFAARLDRTYREFARQVQQQPEVVAVTFADRLPGMGPSVREVQVEPAPGAEPVDVANMWTAEVGPQFFETFGVPLVAGRDFNDTDRGTAARTVLVNEAFARRYMNGASPVGRRVRYTAANASNPEPWFEIVGMVRDVGMTPTDLGEAPYVFQPAAPATVSPLVMGVRVAGDPEVFAPRVRSIASQLDAGLRLDEVRSLDDLAWRVDLPQMIAAGALASIVSLGLFLSSAGIFSLMSVSVARRTREIGLRSALGASRPRLLAGIFTRALVLVGSGVAAGNGVLLLFITLTTEVALSDVGGALIGTSALMLTVGLLGCVEPARRALRIHPTDALRES
jgi:putative ABC transport system permease protein